MNPMKRKVGNMIFNMVNTGDNEIEIFVYSEIYNQKSFDWWTGAEGDEVTPNEFVAELKEAIRNTNHVVLRINSNGGQITAAETIATHLTECRNSGVKLECKIDGICASAAVRLAIACEKIMIPSSAYMMIHNPQILMYGYVSADDARKAATQLDTIKNGIINAYVQRTGLSEKECSKLMDAETYFTGKEAVEKGFADELMFESDEKEVINKISAVFVNCASKLPPALKDAFNKNTNKPKGEETNMDIKNEAELRQAFPDLINKIEQDAKNEGISQERSRLQSIDEMGDKIDGEVLNKAKYETFDTAEKVAVDALKNGKIINKNMLNGLMNDANSANAINGFANAGSGGDEPTKAQKDAKFAENIMKNRFGKDGK